MKTELAVVHITKTIASVVMEMVATAYILTFDKESDTWPTKFYVQPATTYLASQKIIYKLQHFRCRVSTLLIHVHCSCSSKL